MTHLDTDLKVDVVLDLFDEVHHTGADHVTLVQYGSQLWDGLQVAAAAQLVLPDLGQHVLHSLGPPHEVEHSQVDGLALWGKHLNRCGRTRKVNGGAVNDRASETITNNKAT